MRVLLLLCLVAQLSVVTEGDYEVLVTVHSLVLLESRCAECYTNDRATFERGLCCDPGENMESCPSSCDVILEFCQLELELPQSTCTVSFSGFFGTNLNTTEVYQYSETGPIGFPGLELINPVTYTGTSKWREAQLNVSVNDQDQGLNDLIDHFVIPINISAGSSITRNYTGRYNYVQLELTIEVMCVGEDTDENCVFDWCRFNSTNCNNGSCVNEVEGPRCECNYRFIGDYCNEIDDCVSNGCQNGTCVDEDGDYQCECRPGFSGRFCEDNIDGCISNGCQNGTCVDEDNSYRCECHPGFSGRFCEINIDDCISNGCQNGECMDEDNGYRCECHPGFSGRFCEVNIDDCVGHGVTCSGRGECVDEVQNFSCNCDPGYTGAICESEMASRSSLPVAAIAGGVVGGVVCSLILAIILVLVLLALTKRRRRSKRIDMQGTTDSGLHSSKVVLHGGDVHIYDEADEKETHDTGTGGSSATQKEFNNPIYGDVDQELEHEYDTTDEVRSKKHNDQDQELERKFENPVYGDDDDVVQNANSTIPPPPPPPVENNIDYDQVGNVYHTLESEHERMNRYSEAARPTIGQSADVGDSRSKGQTKKPHHSYEDVQ